MRKSVSEKKKRRARLIMYWRKELKLSERNDSHREDMIQWKDVELLRTGVAIQESGPTGDVRVTPLI